MSLTPSSAAMRDDRGNSGQHDNENGDARNLKVEKVVLGIQDRGEEKIVAETKPLGNHLRNIDPTLLDRRRDDINARKRQTKGQPNSARQKRLERARLAPRELPAEAPAHSSSQPQWEHLSARSLHKRPPTMLRFAS